MIAGSIVLEPLGKGVRVTGRDGQGNILWGMVATRTMLEQPHGAVAIYNSLREMLNDSLSVLGLPVSRPEDIVAAAEGKVGELERLAASLRQSITSAKGRKPTEAQVDKARNIYRAAHDAMLWISQEVAIGQESDPDSIDSTDEQDALG
jgi:hypothetical protein